MSDAPFEVAKAHRWFGMDLNNSTMDALDAGLVTPASCEPYLTSLYALTAGVLASLLFGGLGSLIYNVRRSRLVMERFDDTAQGTR